MKEKKIKDLIDDLKLLEEDCEDSCLDLKTLKFDVDEGGMRLYNDFHSYLFKMDPKNPNDPRINLAAKQFCKLMSVPYSFFDKNPDAMKKELVETWLPTLDDEKSTIMARLRHTTGGNFIIRALLPVEHTMVSNVEVLEAVAREIVDRYKIDFVIGRRLDDPVLHVRFISRDKFDVCGEKCAVGFSVIASELGASNLIVETLLYRIKSQASFLTTYQNEPFFSYGYEKIQKTDIKSLFPHLLLHLIEKLYGVKDGIQAAMEQTKETPDLYKLIHDLRLEKGLGEKFHNRLFQEIKGSKVKTLWDFVTIISIVAKKFNIQSRLRIERIAGKLLGLSFSKD